MQGHVKLLNAMYAAARKRTALDDEEKGMIRLAAQMLETALKNIQKQRCVIDELEEKIAIMLEGNGLEKDNPMIDEDFWAEDSCE